jgi:hypothetical protein
MSSTGFCYETRGGELPACRFAWIHGKPEARRHGKLRFVAKLHQQGKIRPISAAHLIRNPFNG